MCVCSVTKLCPSLQPHDCNPPGFTVHGVFQGTVLEWVAISFSMVTYQPRDQTPVLYLVSFIDRQILYHWGTWDVPGLVGIHTGKWSYIHKYIHTGMKVRKNENCCSVVSNILQSHGLYSPPGSSVHGILQARILEWVSILFSRVTSWPKDWT